MSLAETAPSEQRLAAADGSTLFWRLAAWTMLGLLVAFLINNYLTHWLGFPGVLPLLAGGGDTVALSAAQLGLSLLIVAAAIAIVMRDRSVSLRADSERINGFNTFLIRACFWGVVLVGVADAAISFLRVEGLLESVVGEDLAGDLGRSQFRGPYVHIPLIVIGIVLASITRTLGFTWLALLVVLAELAIVIGRFVFSYEQAFLADLVRFWYAALFLFASAYTLLEDGHVRVDVFYAGFSDRTKGFVNSFGVLAMGLVLCWTILLIGMWGPSNIINSPVMSFEVTQAGFGLYVKYLMAVFIGIFAVSMLIQFTAYLLESVADIRGDPGKRQVMGAAGH